MSIFRRSYYVLFPLALAGAFAPALSAQYIISTIAGAFPANGSLSTAVSLPNMNGLAVDAGGNIYIPLGQQNRVVKAAVDGTLSTVVGAGGGGFSGDSGPAVSAQISFPGPLTVDNAGNLYIVDGGNYRIRKISGGIISTVAGNGSFGFSGDGGSATAAQLSIATGIAVDKSGNLFILDNGNYRIRKVSGGVITTIAGNGSAGFSGDNGLATAAQIGATAGIAVDGNGSICFADASNYRVRKISGGVITTIAGTGVSGFGGDGGPASSALLAYLQSLATDLAGNLYIGDGYHVRKVAGGVISTVAGAGTGCPQQTDTAGDGCLATAAVLASISGVAFDGAGNLYVADSSASRVRKVTGGVIATVAGNGSTQFSGDGGLSAKAQIAPIGVAVRAPGNLYVADYQDARVLNLSGGRITTVAGTGVCCYNGDNIAPLTAQVGLAGVAVDAAGTFYTAEGSRVRKISGGIITTVAGTGTEGYSGDNGPATSAQVSAVAVAVDATGNIYFADMTNNRIRKVSSGVITTVAGGGPADGSTATSVSLNEIKTFALDSAGNVYFALPNDNRVLKISTTGIITTVAGNGSQGFSGDNGPATAAQLNYPIGLAVNSAGTAIYIADLANNRIRLVSGGTITTIAGGGSGCTQQTDYLGDNCPGASASLFDPIGLALDGTGTVLYIADLGTYRIRKLTGGVISTVAGNGANGYSGDNGPATAAQLNYASAVAVDNNTGALYIGDSGNYRVRKVLSGVISTVAGTGVSGYSGDNGPATSAQLSGAYGLAVDSTGNLYIADTLNSRIRKVVSGVITTVAGTGISGYSGDNVTATSAQLSSPNGVAVDGQGNFYIVDSTNNRIRKVSGGVISTIAGNGSQSFSGDGGPAVQAQLSQPAGLAVDNVGNLYIADTFNSRLRQVSSGGIITTIAGNGNCCGPAQEGPATAVPIFPTSVAADNSGNVFISELYFNRVRKVFGGVITNVAGNGAQGYSGDSGLATNASLKFPQGLGVDSLGNIYIADTGNNAVRLLTMNPRTISSVSPSSALAGSAGFTIQVSGSGFISGDIVQWNGTNLTTTFVSSGQLSATVNSSLIAQAGTAAVTINGISNAAAFTLLSTLTPSLRVSKTHSGIFTQSQLGATYTVTVSNASSAGPTSGTVTLTETIPAGLNLVSMSGSGWTCPSANTSCTRSDALPTGSSYPPITVTVNVASNASAQLTNQVTVSGGASASATSTDLTTVSAGALRGPVSVGVFQPSVNAWLIDANENGVFDVGDRYFQFLGLPGDTAVVGDWTGDGKAKVGIFHNGFWLLDMNNNGVWDGTTVDRLIALGGQPGDIPVVGDWNGDGRTKVGINRNGFWLLDTNGNGVYDSTDQFLAFGGNPGEQPVVGDWNGDGRTKVGFLYNGVWKLDYNGNGVFDIADRQYYFPYVAGDKAVVGDWNGSRTTKIGIYRNGFWILDYNGNGQYDGVPTDRFSAFGGNPGEVPVLGDWNGDGRTKIGVYYKGFWSLDYNGNGQWDGNSAGQDRFIAFGGVPGEQPIVGAW